MEFKRVGRSTHPIPPLKVHASSLNHLADAIHEAIESVWNYPVDVIVYHHGTGSVTPSTSCRQICSFTWKEVQ
jgi:hypothetical protein